MGGWEVKIYCTLWIREAVTPNWSFWGNLGLAGPLDLATLMTQAQYKLNNHLMGGSTRSRCANAL